MRYDTAAIPIDSSEHIDPFDNSSKLLALSAA